MDHPDVTVASTVDKLVTERLDTLMTCLADTDGSLSTATIAELARLIGAVSALREIHSANHRGRCQVCRPSALSRRRGPCTVYETLDFFIGPQPGVLPAAQVGSGRHDAGIA
jgi:hypothetical protein